MLPAPPPETLTGGPEEGGGTIKLNNSQNSSDVDPDPDSFGPVDPDPKI